MKPGELFSRHLNVWRSTRRFVFVDLATAGRIEKFLLNHCMPAELGTDLLNQCLLFGGAFGGCELGKQIFHLTVVGLQQGDGVEMGLTRHDYPLSRGGSIIAPSKV